MSGAGAPPPQGPNPVDVIRALRAMSHLMAQGAEGARTGEKEVAALLAEHEIKFPGPSFTNDAFRREAVTLGLLAGSLEAVSGLASMMALLLVDIESIRHQQNAVLQRLGPRIIIPGGDA